MSNYFMKTFFLVPFWSMQTFTGNHEFLDYIVTVLKTEWSYDIHTQTLTGYYCGLFDWMCTMLILCQFTLLASATLLVIVFKTHSSFDLYFRQVGLGSHK